MARLPGHRCPFRRFCCSKRGDISSVSSVPEWSVRVDIFLIVRVMSDISGWDPNRPWLVLSVGKNKEKYLSVVRKGLGTFLILYMG